MQYIFQSFFFSSNISLGIPKLKQQLSKPIKVKIFIAKLSFILDNN